jgi:hypothetical protein
MSQVASERRQTLEARDGRTVAVLNVETGEGHSEDGWERDKGVNGDVLANAR